MGECLVSHLIPVGSIITHTWIQKSIYLFIYSSFKTILS